MVFLGDSFEHGLRQLDMAVFIVVVGVSRSDVNINSPRAQATFGAHAPWPCAWPDAQPEEVHIPRRVMDRVDELFQAIALGLREGPRHPVAPAVIEVGHDARVQERRRRTATEALNICWNARLKRLKRIFGRGGGKRIGVVRERWEKAGGGMALPCAFAAGTVET